MACSACGSPRSIAPEAFILHGLYVVALMAVIASAAFSPDCRAVRVMGYQTGLSLLPCFVADPIAFFTDKRTSPTARAAGLLLLP